MFQIVLSLAVGVLIGWNFHLFYISLEPKKLIPKSLTLSEEYTPLPKKNIILKQHITEEKVDKSEQNISTEIPINRAFSHIKLVKKRVIKKENPFEVLLNQNNFSDAMAFYIEGTPKEIKSYKLILKVYFYDKATSSPNETIEQLLQYIEIEPQNLDFQLYLAKLYRAENEFEKSINFLFELQHNYQDKNLKLITNDLDTAIENYIKRLNDSKNISKLIDFLEETISKSITPEKYIIRLAELYKNLEIYDKSQELISEINSDSTYINQANTLMEEIQLNQTEIEKYPHKIPLNKIDSQFTVNLTINNTPLTLLLDTGASYTFIDTDKIHDLEDGKEIILNTAGGEIVGELYQTQSLIIQDIELKDFQITVAPFKNQHTDGLLGMNFFKKFNFKIDQEKAMLYLGEK